MTRCYEFLDGILAKVEQNEPLTKEQLEHIESCESCKAFYEDMHHVFELERTGQLEALPDTFQATFRERLEEESREQASSESHSGSLRVSPFVKYKKWVPSLGAAAILMIAIVGSGTIPGLIEGNGVKEAAVGDMMTRENASLPPMQSALPDVAATTQFTADGAYGNSAGASDGADAKKASNAPAPEASADAPVVSSMPMVTGSTPVSPDVNARAFTAAEQENVVGEQPKNDEKLKIIKNGMISLETTEFDVNLAKIEAITTTLNGQVTSKNIVQVSNGSPVEGKAALRTAWLQVKIPTTAFEEAISAMRSNGLLVSTSENSQDITREYHDVDSHIKNLRAREISLRDLMTKATDMKSLLEIDQALAEVRSQIDALTATRTSYDQSIAYSTIEVNLVEVESITQSLKVSPVDQLKAGLGDSGKLLSMMFEKGLYVTALLTPYGLIFFGAKSGMKRIMKLKRQ